MKIWKAVGLAALFAVAVPVGCSFLGTATTVATAPGRVINKTLQTDNIINNYEWFFDAKGQYDARLAQVEEYALIAELETEPAEKARVRTELSAMRQSCRELAAQYNSNASKANRSIFQSGDLPTQLSETECNA